MQEINNKKGLFIVFEGPDGSGKSTQIEIVAKELRQQGYKVTTTREPGGSQFGEKVRTLIMENHISKRTEALLMAAARSDHLETVIKPAIERGEIVLCDYYIMASLVFQGFEGGQLKLVEEITAHFSRDITPDATLVFSVSAETALARKNNCGATRKNKLDPSDIQQALERKHHYENLVSAHRTDASYNWLLGPVIKVDADMPPFKLGADLLNFIVALGAATQQTTPLIPQWVFCSPNKKLGRGLIIPTFYYPAEDVLTDRSCKFTLEQKQLLDVARFTANKAVVRSIPQGSLKAPEHGLTITQQELEKVISGLMIETTSPTPVDDSSL